MGEKGVRKAGRGEGAYLRWNGALECRKERNGRERGKVRGREGRGEEGRGGGGGFFVFAWCIMSV